MNKGKNVLVFLFISIMLMFILGCASIVSKSSYKVVINSKPQGADISVQDGAGKTVFTGKTPATVKLNAGAGFFKGEDYTVTFKLDGYSPHQTRIHRGVDGWYVLGNIFLGGLIGWLIVDPATGAMWKLEDNVHAELNSLSVKDSEENTSLHIISINDIPERYRNKLVKIN